MRILLALYSVALVAADWPQFQGPQRDGTCPETLAPWKTVKELWKVKIGPAHASPVIANGTLYAYYRRKGVDEAHDLEVLAAHDPATGAVKWEKTLEKPFFESGFGSGPQGTPSVADGRIFTYGNTGLLTARDAKTGDLLWSVDTLKEFNAKNLRFGVSVSPLVVGKRVIVMVGAKDAGIVAFDVATGKVDWKATSDPGSYSSPIAHGDTLTFLTGSHLRALSADGKELWNHPFKDRLNESSTMPVVLADTVIGSSITRGTVALKVKDGKTETRWGNEMLKCFFSTPVVVDKHLYMINGVTGPNALADSAVNLRCVELATGKMVWEKEKVGSFHAALVKMKDNTLLMLDDKGHLSLVKPNPEKYEELAKTKVCGITWSSPAVVDGVVYLRDNTHLYALKPE